MTFALAVVAYLILLGIVAVVCEKYTALVGIGGLIALIGLGALLP